MKRRNVMKGAAGAAAVAAVPTAVVYAGSETDGKPADAHAHHDSAQQKGVYTETYKGRTITVSEADETVQIDGRELRLMKMGEGAYLSDLCHYQMVATPLEAARRAVDELRGAQLAVRPSGGTHHHTA